MLVGSYPAAEMQLVYSTDPANWAILTGNSNPSQSGPESNGNEGVLHSAQISRTGSSPLEIRIWPCWQMVCLGFMAYQLLKVI